ncbi:MAG TPA: hypothetical protein VJ111_05880 [Chitinophagaceae bacterium]|nr:hypothetical protein [Chitinophagaceae bacterium]
MKKSIFFCRLHAFLLFLFITIAQLAYAQNYIDDDFLDNIESNARFMLNEPAPAFTGNTIPDKWKKESAIVMGYSRSVLFDRKSSGGFFSRKERSLYFLEKVRFKIKLNDNNSVQAFSEIYFRYGAKEDGFIARIIKPDETVVNVDLKNAVGIETSNKIPEFFQSFFDQIAYSQYKYYKIPVANLEPGDILEYITTTKSRLDVTSSGYVEFEPSYEVCSKKYPLIYNEIIFETDDKSFFKSLSLNGAPQFVKENSAEKSFFRYVFTDKNREVEKDINFVKPFLQYALVKFQIIYSNSDQAKGALIGEKGELKKEFSKEELARKAWEDYEMVSDGPLYDGPPSVQAFINACWAELKKTGANKLPAEQYINQVYYLIRNKILFRNRYLSDKKFAHIFGSLLFQRDIKSDLVITISNNVGKLKEILFGQEIRYIIKVDNKLFFNVTDFSNPGDLEESLLDNEAYIIYAPAKKGGQQEIKPFTLPGTSAADNMAEIIINTELSSGMNSLLVARTSSYKGIHKAINSDNALRFTPYIFDDYKNYNGNSPTDNMKSREAEDYYNSIQALKEEYKKQKPEFVKESLQSEYNQRVSNVHFNLINDGRTQKKNTLIFKEGFELTDFVRKAGKKYMVNLAGLTGSQLQIKKEERERKYDIDVRYPRTFSWTITFKIPDGYTVEGLTEINKKVKNETGSFSIAAKEENGSVILNITKEYRTRKISKTKWNEMLAFIDAAYNSSFRYILLKPKQ